jgi:DNA repair exonuclease SbcCD nuclease subunit
MSISFLHISDLHLGYQQYGSRDRFNDFGHAFHHAVDYALEERLSFVIISGDLFHKSAIDPPTLLQAVFGLDKLRNAEIPVISVVGNHDRARYVDHVSWLDYLSERQYLSLLSPKFSNGNIHFSPWDGMNGGYIDIGPVRVLGLPYLGASTEAALHAIPASLEGLPTDGVEYTIMLAHFGLEGEMPVMAGGIPQTAVDPLVDYVDYLALGHLHKAFQRADWIYNPGSLETTAMDQRLWPGGYYHVQIQYDQDPKHEAKHIPNRRRTFLRWPFDVELYRDPVSLNDGLQTFLEEQAAAKKPADQPVVEISLEGVLGFDRSALDLEGIQELVSEIFDPLIVRVKNHTRPTAFELPTGEHLSRHELEQQILIDLVHQDSRYRAQAEDWANIIQRVKKLVLSDQEPSEIIDAVRHETDRQESD